MPLSDYIRVGYPEPHIGRGRAILAAHPDLRELAGPMRSSAAWIVLIAAAQLALAIALRHAHWYVWLPCAYLLGATFDHALWVLIHECSHNLVFRGRNANRVISMVANVPIVVPGAISFTKYHLLHHRHLGEIGLDAGIPGPGELRLVGGSRLGKAVWIAGHAVVQGSRPAQLGGVKLFDAWTWANIVVQVVAMGAIVVFAGPGPLKYLVVSTLFAIGLHPLGGRWVQEHFALAPDQETYSYYGPLNKVSFNVGYHVEHHDLISVPWARLPEIRRRAPEFYDSLRSYRSWSGLLARFIWDRNITLYRYIIRPLLKDQKISA